MRFIKFSALLATLIFGNANALQVQCLEVQNGSITDVEIRSSSNFQNCFYIDNPAISNISLISVATPGLDHKITYSNIDDFGTLTKISEVNSSGDYAATASFAPNGRRIGFSLLPTVALASNKIISISYAIKEGRAVVLINVSNVAAPYFPPPQTCVPRPGVHCSNSLPGTPMSPLFKGAAGLHATTTTGTSCSSGQKQPAGKPANFDLDEHLAKFAAMKKATEMLGPVEKPLVRSMMLSSNFYVNRPYDLTVNPKYPGATSQFVNYFYGMAAQRIGFTENTAVTAGAVVQQVQNWKNTGGKLLDVGEMFANMTFAAISGLGDSPGDAENIQGGFRDAQACETSTTPPRNPPLNGNDAPGNPGTPIGGWQGGSISPPAGCYGRCGGGSGTVTVSPPIPVQTSQ